MTKLKKRGLSFPEFLKTCFPNKTSPKKINYKNDSNQYPFMLFILTFHTFVQNLNQNKSFGNSYQKLCSN